MTSTADELQSRWSALPRPAGVLLEAERVASWVGGDILAALDADGRRHLLVAIADEADQVRDPRPVRGLTLSRRHMRAAGLEGLWLDLALEDVDAEPAFTAICAAVVDALALATAPDARTTVHTLERWRRFWAQSGEGLSRERQLGLIGELWLLLEWVPMLTVSALDAWQGPLGGRHDFVTSTVSVEVKTTGGARGPALHRVVSLDQLDEPLAGDLFLFALRVAGDPLGDVSLDSLIDRARSAAKTAGETTQALLDARLGAIGWTVADAGRYTTSYRLVRQGLYRVDAAFPRLTRASLAMPLPSAITDLSYTIDLAGLDEWLVADAPHPDGPIATLVG